MQEGPKTVADLCQSLGISNGSSRSVLVRMRKKGLLTRVGKGRYEAVLD
jgi:predicted transcriptional regulator of viral defense system